MAALTGLSTADIQADRVGIAERFAREWEHVVVLKGAHTVVADPEGETRIIPIAHSALASAGTGDVLAGVIVGLMAQGLDSFEAAFMGAWLHARAGIIAADQVGSAAAVRAGDVCDALAQACR
jgi:NAD(P)H-hydrate epimerase